MQTLELPPDLDIERPFYKQSEAFLKTGYARQARQYRHDDEIEVTTEHHRHLRSVLESLSNSFDRPIRVLDAGCGTGRYFHCIRNATELVGLDLCPEMLDAARSPVFGEQVTVGKIGLVCENIFEVSFPSRSFDLIYSLGMFALGCPLTSDICRKFHDWLAPGGGLFFNVTDRTGIARSKLLKRQARKLVYRLAPQRIKKMLDRPSAFPDVCALSRSELARFMSQSLFNHYRIESQPCLSPLWRGRHLECLAWKADSLVIGN